MRSMKWWRMACLSLAIASGAATVRAESCCGLGLGCDFEQALSSDCDAPAVPTPCECLLCRDQLTGDWHGLRTSLADKGVTFNLYATQFYQGVADGGRLQDWEYGAKLDYLMKVEGGKLGLNPGLFVDFHAETRLGSSVNPIDGLLLPSNIAMNFPDPNRHVTSITGLTVTQALSETFAVYGGKINTLDSYGLQYFGGPGLGGFMNTALVFNPIMARTVPYSAAGVGAAVLRGGKPFLALTVFDPQERATDGMEDLYERGVVLVPDLTFHTTMLGLPGIYNFGGTYSNADYTSVDPSAWLTLPSLGTLPRETGSWSVYSNFYQALWADAGDAKRSWGVFGQFGLSDGNPNPIQWVANAGIGGRSMIRGRDLDRFGAGFFYNGLSDELKSQGVVSLQDEYGVELFYNYAISAAVMLTADLQVVEPAVVNYDTAIIPGVRLQAIF